MSEYMSADSASPRWIWFVRGVLHVVLVEALTESEQSLVRLVLHTVNALVILK